jgi:general stress protein 26
MNEGMKALELLKSYRTAMLVTHDGDGLEARPMEIAQIEPEGGIWFFTGANSRKVQEIAKNPDVLITCQDEHSSYLTLRGSAYVTEDRDKARELWSAEYQAWFPGGVDDPELVLLHVDPHLAEYWDNRGPNKVRYLFEAAKALATGTRPQVDEQHGRTAL